MTRFQIWTKERTPTQGNQIARQIEKAIPAGRTSKIAVIGNIIYEFFNMKTNQWEEFLLEDTDSIFNWHISQGFPPGAFEWRKSGGSSVGSLIISRGNPFLQPRSNDEIDISIIYGNIETRSHLIY